MCIYNTSTPVKPLVSFYTLWEHQTTSGCQIFSVGIESDQWHAMDSSQLRDERLKSWHLCIHTMVFFDYVKKIMFIHINWVFTSFILKNVAQKSYEVNLFYPFRVNNSIIETPVNYFAVHIIYLVPIWRRHLP